jgi:hypothetical protein
MYGTVDRFLQRYPQTKISSSDISTVYLPDAADYLDSTLGGSFIVPFSSNAVTVEKLAYLKADHLIRIRQINPKDAGGIGQFVDGWLEQLKRGEAGLLVTSLYPSGGSAVVFARRQDAPPEGQVRSSTGAYNPVFTMDDPLHQTVDPNLVLNLRSARGEGYGGSGY